MKSLSKSIQTLCIASSFLIPLTAKSDVFVMKDGSRLKGVITKQTYEHYTLKYEIAENVLGEKVVLVKDVVQIIKDDVSIKDYQRIKGLFPTSDFLTLKDYQKIKTNYIDKFYATHPRSKYTEDVQKLQKQLDEEHDNLKNGGLKIDGELLNKAQIDANKYEVEAILQLRQIEHDIQNKQYTSALRAFEEMELHYEHTRPFPKAVVAVQRILPGFISNLTEVLGSVDAELKKKEKYIERLPSTEKKRVTDLLQKDVTDYQASLLNAKEELKTKWLPLNKYEKEPIDLVLKHAISEQKRLATSSEKKIVDGGKLYRMILSAIHDKDPETGDKLLREFNRLKPPEKYSNDLKLAILATKDAAEARKEREKIAADEAKKAKKAADLARKNEAKEKGSDKSAEDSIKDKLNINKKEKALREAEKLLE